MRSRHDHGRDKESVQASGLPQHAASQVGPTIVKEFGDELTALWITINFDFGGLEPLRHSFSRSFLCPPNILRLLATNSGGQHQ